MANRNNVYQQVHTVSIKRDRILELATNLDLSKKDYRVLLVLLTQLDGYEAPIRRQSNWKDPMNFRVIDIDSIADVLTISHKDAKKSIEHLHDQGIIETGSSETVHYGYRFTF